MRFFTLQIIASTARGASRNGWLRKVIYLENVLKSAPKAGVLFRAGIVVFLQAQLQCAGLKMAKLAVDCASYVPVKLQWRQISVAQNSHGPKS